MKINKERQDNILLLTFHYLLRTLFIFINPTPLPLLLIFASFSHHLAHGLSLQSERQQVPPSVQDSSQYSGRSYKSSSFDSLCLSSDFHLIKPITKTLGILRISPITIVIRVFFMFHSFFCYLARSRYLSFVSFPFIFNLWSPGWQSQLVGTVIFFC